MIVGHIHGPPQTPPREFSWGTGETRDTHLGYICGPGPRYYLARLHRKGARRMEVVSRHRTKKAAARAALMAVAKDKGYPEINRADVLMVEKEFSYYDPAVIWQWKQWR